MRFEALATLAVVAWGQTFLDEKLALEKVLPGCGRVDREEKVLTSEDRGQLEKVTGLRFPVTRYTFWIGACGYAVLLNEIGKSEPITFLVGVDREGRAGEVALMVFRESRGAEVREPRFTRQFRGKSPKDPIRVNQDILNYTGATLSSEAMARGVKKALALVAHYYLPKQGAGLYTREAWVMGTLARVQVYAAEETTADEQAGAALAELRRLEDRFTSFRDSELTRLNAAAGEAPVRVSEEMFELLELSVGYARRYAGVFDPTVGPLVRAWGFLGGPFRVPGAQERRRLRASVGVDALEMDRAARTVRFGRAGMELDLGGIAKGYAAEKAARLLARRGVERGLVNIGESSLFALGAPPAEAAWPVAVRDPHPPHQAAVVIRLPPWSALSTSGTYGRFFRAGGRVYSHLFDPRTGEPLEGEAAATVVCRSGAESEAAVKAVLLAPEAWDKAATCEPWVRLIH